MPDKKKIIVIVGPTASGKTHLAIELAKKINGEIISADSMQAYKGMPVISQAPSKKELRSVRHHLVGFLDPGKEYSAALFAKLAKKRMENMLKRRKIPIVVGGSGLYIKSLVDGLFPSRGKNEKLRKKLWATAEKESSVALHDTLKKMDPNAASRIHQNDTKRIIRAIEICKIEKNTKTALQKKTKGIKDKYEIEMMGIKMDRNILYERINKRVEEMFKKGLLKEVKKLLGKKLSITAGQALGIRQIKTYLEKKCGIEEAKEILKKDTRRFAKRQLTWFRADKRIKWVKKLY